MRLSPLTSRGRVEDEGSAATGRSRSGRVRMSILSKELFILAGLLGGVGYVVVADHGAEPAHHAGMSSLRGHEGVIESLAFASDGKTLISCGWDRTVRTWAVGDGPVRMGEGDRHPGERGPLVLGLDLPGRESTWRPRGRTRSTSGAAIRIRGGGRLTSATAGATMPWRCPPMEGSSRWGVGTGRSSSGRCPAGRRSASSSDSPTNCGRSSFLGTDRHLGGTSFAGEFTAWERSPGSAPRRHPLQPEKVQTFAFAADNRSVAIAQWSPDLRSLGTLGSGNREPRVTILGQPGRRECPGGLARRPDPGECGRGPVDQLLGHVHRQAQGTDP